MHTTTNEIPKKKPRGRPPKVTTSISDLKQQIIETEGQTKAKSKRRPTPDEIAAKHKEERETEKLEYKAEMQRYLKERLRQDKAKVKLELAVKQLEAKIKAA